MRKKCFVDDVVLLRVCSYHVFVFVLNIRSII